MVSVNPGSLPAQEPPTFSWYPQPYTQSLSPPVLPCPRPQLWWKPPALPEPMPVTRSPVKLPATDLRHCLMPSLPIHNSHSLPVTVTQLPNWAESPLFNKRLDRPSEVQFLDLPYSLSDPTLSQSPTPPHCTIPSSNSGRDSPAKP